MLHSPEILAKQDFGDRNVQALSEMSGKVSANFWRIVEDRLQQLPVERPRIYVESYHGTSVRFEPGTEPTDKIIDTPEARVIAALLKRVGGTVETTENPKLVEENMQIARELGDAYHAIKDSKDDYEEKTGDPELMIIKRVKEALGPILIIAARMEEVAGKRDAFIAGRIDETLQDGETGILFLGGNHNVESRLPGDIQIEILDKRLNEIRKEIAFETEHEGHFGGHAEGKN